MKAVSIVLKTFGSILLLPFGILFGLGVGAILLLMMTMAFPIHFISALWCDEPFLNFDDFIEEERPNITHTK